MDLVLPDIVVIIGVPALLAVGSILTLLVLFKKVPELRFFMTMRMFMKEKILVRIHYYNNYEGWALGHKDKKGRIFIFDEKNKPIAVDPKSIHQNKNSYRAGMDIVDISSNSLWPIGVTECIHVHEVDDFINNTENNCPRLKGMDELTRHTILATPAGEIRDRIKALISIDDNGLLHVDRVDKIGQEEATRRIREYNNLYDTEVKAVVDEITRVKEALQGKVIMDRVFSWTEPVMTINSQLQTETVGEIEWYVKNIIDMKSDPTTLIKWAIIGAIIIFAIGGAVYMITQ